LVAGNSSARGGLAAAFAGGSGSIGDAEKEGGPIFANEVKTWLAAKDEAKTFAAAGLVRECQKLGAY
jgi:hypothetical protein